MTATAAIARERLSAQTTSDRAVVALQAQHATELARKDQQLRVQARVHEATRPSRSRKRALDWGSGDNIVGQDAAQLRAEARRLERDHDISRNALNILEQNIVGSGIDVLPAPRLPGQPIDEGLALDLRMLWDDWWDKPEVSRRHDFGKCQQLLARSAFRDGEVFFQALSGPVAYLDHRSQVPFSIEMIEADMVPLDLYDPSRRIKQGVEVDAWGAAQAFHVYKEHPGDGTTLRLDTKRVPADVLHQLALIDRISQVRGLSIFASVIPRLADIKDYEDSERIAAKVAASLSAQIIKGDHSHYGTGTGQDAGMLLPAAAASPEYRALTMRPGLIADDLLPGEKIELIDSKRPNPNAELFRSGQLRAASGGFRVSFSSLARNYDGTYSAQRQELVEQWGAYQMLGEWYIARVSRPLWVSFVQAALYSGLVKLPRGWSLRNVAAATFVRPVMPWIDPLKEAKAREIAEDRLWSPPQRNVIELGGDPESVLEQRRDWDQRCRDLDLQPAARSAPSAADPEDPE